MSMHERRSEMRTCRTQRSMLERAVFGWPMPVPVWPMPCDRLRGVLRVGPCTPGGHEDRGDALAARFSRRVTSWCSDKVKRRQVGDFSLFVLACFWSSGFGGFAHARPRARRMMVDAPCLRGHALATTTRKALLLTPSPPVRARPGHCALRARRRAPPDGPLAAASRRRTRTKVVRSATVSA